MRFLVDENIGPTVARWLRDEGHEVFSVYEEMRGASDSDLLRVADKDFGELVFREHRSHKGVVLLRLSDERARSKLNVLKTLLAGYGDQLAGSFVVAAETGVRLVAS